MTVLDGPVPGGDLRLVLAEPDSLRVRWSPPENVARELISYRVSDFPASLDVVDPETKNEHVSFS